MSNVRTSVLPFALLSALLLAPSLAFAKTVTMDVSGFAVIGRPSGAIGSIWMAIAPWDGSACHWTFIFNGTKLPEDLLIQGTAQADSILVLETNASGVCGDWQPLNQNGHWVNVKAGDGDDAVALGSGFAGNQVDGEGGNDSIWGGLFDTFMYGGAGNDFMFGRDPTQDSMLGFGGDDHLCEPPGTVGKQMDGGWGFDTRCGSARTMLNIDGVACVPCGF